MNKKEQSPVAVPVPKTPWAFFFFITRQHQAWALLAITAVTFSAIFNTSLSYFFKLIIEAVEQNNLEAAMFWGLLYPVAVLFIQLLYRLSGYAGMHWTVGSNKTAMDTLVAYLLKHSHTYYIDRFAGSITNKVRNVIGAFDEMIPDFLWSHLNAFVTFIVTYLFIVAVDTLAATLFLALIVVLVVVNKKFAPKKALVSRAHAEAGTKLQGKVVDVFSNAAAVRQYVQHEHEMSGIADLTLAKYKAGLANWFYTEKLLLVNSFILFLFAGSMFWLLVTKWGAGDISTGDFVLVLALVSNITGTLLFIGRAFNATARTVGELREGLEDILIPYEITDVPGAVPVHIEHGAITWERVSFSFGGQTVFRNFSINIPGKERIGLVGSSGAGKSTFVSLLLRQYDVASGVIMLDGQNISEVTQDSLRQAIAVVPQEPALFHRSIRENIAYGKPGATDEEIRSAAAKAQAQQFIEALADGYDTVVGERGVKLSGGQKQRIAIARAILKNAPILVLDEATSALDSESEREIQKALHTLMEGKTVIAIAHRLSTLREMDKIIVLEDGEIQEQGSHTELLAASGYYARLWKHQTDGFLNETSQ